MLVVWRHTSCTFKRGALNSLVRLAYFHTNCLLIELYKQETEIRCRKDDSHIKKKTDIDCHCPVPYSISSLLPDPPSFFITHYL